jgi:molybdate transport system substrate-binding protein
VKRFLVFIFLVVIVFLALRYFQVPATETISITAVAPDYLDSCLNMVADQFFEENLIKVNIIYVHPDSVVNRARFDQGVDLFISGNRRWFDRLRRDTLVYNRDFSCPFQMSLVLIGRPDGPQTDDLSDLKDSNFTRVVIVDPELNYDGRLAKSVLERKRLWKKLKTKLIEARSVEHLFSYLITGEADAAILLESSTYDHSGFVIMKRLNDDLGKSLLHCGAVTAFSKNKRPARAFVDLLESPQCALYKIQGIYRSGEI